jgi:hypothetical protein
MFIKEKFSGFRTEMEQENDGNEMLIEFQIQLLAAPL